MKCFVQSAEVLESDDAQQSYFDVLAICGGVDKRFAWHGQRGDSARGFIYVERNIQDVGIVFVVYGQQLASVGEDGEVGVEQI